MADLTLNGAGVVVILDNEEVNGVIDGSLKLGGGAGGLITGLAGAVAGLTAGAAAAIAGAVGAYFAAQAFLVKQVNKGCGVYLTLPWPAVWFGQLYLIIAGTRPCLTPGSWSTLDSGELRTESPSDRISYSISRGTGDLKLVSFELYQGKTSGWKKELHVPGGAPPYVVVEGKNRGATINLAASQLAVTNSMTFKKAGFLGRITPVLNLRDISGLSPGDKVRFSWNKD
jgi:hypothetical protein